MGISRLLSFSDRGSIFVLDSFSTVVQSSAPNLRDARAGACRAVVLFHRPDLYNRSGTALRETGVVPEKRESRVHLGMAAALITALTMPAAQAQPSAAATATDRDQEG